MSAGASTPRGSPGRAPRLELEGLTVRLPTAARPILSPLHLRLEAGEVVGILGHSGCGKTTLLHAVAGLLPWLRPAIVSGSLRLDGESLAELDPGQRARLLATCLDRPSAQLFLQTPRGELDAAERLHGRSGLLPRVVERLGLESLLDRRTTTLSSGECQRVALAVALAAAPRPVLLDEPSVHLDPGGVAALADALGEVGRAGGVVLLTEQSGWRLAAVVHRWLRLDAGRLAPAEAPQSPSLPVPPHPPGTRPVLSTEGLTVARGGRRILEGVDLELRQGEVVLVTGPNGAGKTSLARVLAGVDRPAGGRVRRGDRPPALMLPSADLQLFATSVAEELELLGVGAEEGARVLARHRLEHLAARSPWTLSRGERQRLVHATLDLLRPEVMIVDEPGQGLDGEDLARLVQLIHRRARKGRSYLVISHREELAAAAHRWLEIRDGRLVENGGLAAGGGGVP